MPIKSLKSWGERKTHHRGQKTGTNPAGIIQKKANFNDPTFITKGSPEDWLVAFCDRRENRGVWGESVVFGLEISLCPWQEGERTESFSGLCTVLQFADGGVSIPPWSVGRGRFGE